MQLHVYTCHSSYLESTTHPLKYPTGAWQGRGERLRVGPRLRDPHEIPLYILSVLVNLLIIAFVLAGALLLGFLNALAGEPLSGAVVDAIRVAFFALLLLVLGLVVIGQAGDYTTSV